MIATTGTIVIDLHTNSELHDRKLLLDGASWPVGVRVIVEVGDRTFVHPWTVQLLQQRGRNAVLDVHGSPDAVTAWLSALRGSSTDRQVS